VSRIIVDLEPREQFLPYFHRKERWACMVVHRRGGKTFCCIQDLIAKALTHKRDGPALRYAYIAPTRDQAKDIAFAYLRDFCGRIPKTDINKADLLITLPNEATIRLYSGESYDRMRGLYFDGVILDEMGDIDPQAWYAVIRPCLSDYQGWGTFIGTPKGKNIFWKIHQESMVNPDWFSLTLRASTSGILSEVELRDIRKGTPEHVFRQEYECDFNIGRPGAIYAQDLDKAREEGRVSESVEWFRELPVYSSWDVGAPRNQKVWLWQVCGDRINFLESLTGDDECATPATWAARLLAKRYSYGSHFLPHDACMANGGLWDSGLKAAGLSDLTAVPRQLSVWDGINTARDAFPRCRFNLGGCEDGMESLDAYHAKEERDGVTIKDVPVHDYSSHYSDAFSLAHQAIAKGLVVNRAGMAQRGKSKASVTVLTGISNQERRVIR
jgi:phage terminase large subunit